MELHLTVSKDGVISLWDTPSKACTAAVFGETYIRLKLTPEQQLDLEWAQKLATANNRPDPS